jgi:hypothetical protein
MALKLKRRTLAQSFGPVFIAIARTTLLKASVGCIKMVLGARVFEAILRDTDGTKEAQLWQGNSNNERLFSTPFESRLAILPMILKSTTV